MNDVAPTAKTRAQQVIDDCLEAYKTCLQTAAYCVDRGLPQLIPQLHDCADLSLSMANLLLRASPFHRPLAALYQEAASACADGLSKMEHQDPQLRTAYAVCQRACRACVELLSDEEEVEEDARDVALRDTFPASDPPPPPTEL